MQWTITARCRNPVIPLGTFSRPTGRLHLNAMSKVCYTYPVVLLWDIDQAAYRPALPANLLLYRLVYVACTAKAVDKLLDNVSAGVMNGVVSLARSHIRRVTLAYMGSLPVLASPDY